MGIPIDSDHRQPGRQRAAAAAIPERLPAGAADHASRLSRQPRALPDDQRLRHRRAGIRIAQSGDLLGQSAGGAAAAGEDHRLRRHACSPDAVAIWTGTADLPALAGQRRHASPSTAPTSRSPSATTPAQVAAEIDAADRHHRRDGDARSSPATPGARPAPTPTPPSISAARRRRALMTELGLTIGTTNADQPDHPGRGVARPDADHHDQRHPPFTVTFGTGAGEVSTLAELQPRLARAAGGTAHASTPATATSPSPRPI